VWGRYADRVGTARVLKLTGPLVGVIPLLWLWGRTPLALMAVEVVSGFLWSGFELCVAAYLYDAVPAGNRMRTLAYFNVVNGAAAFAGTSLGGVLVDRLPPMLGSSLLSIFFLSSMLRFAVNGLFVRGFHETRVVRAGAPALPALAGRLAGRVVVPLAVRPYRRARRRARRFVARVVRV
jgi:hypothetical protein